MEVDRSGSRLAVAYGPLQVVVPLAAILGDARFTTPTDEELAARSKSVSDTLHAELHRLRAASAAAEADFQRRQVEDEECGYQNSDGEERPGVSFEDLTEQRAQFHARADEAQMAACRALPCVRLWACKTQGACGQAASRGFVPAMVLEGADASAVMRVEDTITGPSEDHVLSFSPTGDRLARAIRSDMVSIHDARTGRLQTIVSTPFTTHEALITSIHWLPVVQGAALLIKTEAEVLTVVEIPARPVKPAPVLRSTPPASASVPMESASSAPSRPAPSRGTCDLRQRGVSGWLDARAIGLVSRRQSQSVWRSIRRRSRGRFALRELPGPPITALVKHRADPSSDQDCKPAWLDLVVALGRVEPDRRGDTLPGQALCDVAEHDMWDGEDTKHPGAPSLVLLRTENCEPAREGITGDRQAWQDQTEEQAAVEGCTHSLGAITQQAYVCETCMLRAQGCAAAIRAAEAHGWLGLEASRLLLSLSSGVDLDLCKPVPLREPATPVGAKESKAGVETSDSRIKRLLDMQLPPTSIVPTTLCEHCAKTCHEERGHVVRALGQLDRWVCECASFRAETMLENCPFHRTEMQQYGAGCGSGKRKVTEPTAALTATTSAGLPTLRPTVVASEFQAAIAAPRRKLASAAQLRRAGLHPDSTAWAIATGRSSLEWAQTEAAWRGVAVKADAGHDHRSFGIWCRCLQGDSGDMVQCVACQDWFHSACLNDIGPPAVLEASRPLPMPDSPEDLSLIDDDDACCMICAACVRLYMPGLVKNWPATDLGSPEVDDALKQLLDEVGDGAVDKRARGLTRLIAAEEAEAAAAEEAAAGRPKRAALQRADVEGGSAGANDTAADAAASDGAAEAASGGQAEAASGWEPEEATVGERRAMRLARKLLETINCQSTPRTVLQVRQDSRNERGRLKVAELRVCRGAVQVVSVVGRPEDFFDWIEGMGVMSATSSAVARGQIDLVRTSGNKDCLVPSHSYREAATIPGAAWRLCGLFDHRDLHKRMFGSRPSAFLARFLPAPNKPVVLAALPHSDSVHAMNAALEAASTH